MTLVYDCNCSHPDSDCPHHYELRPEEYDALLAERDEWEQRYEELLQAVGGVWPG